LFPETLVNEVVDFVKGKSTLAQLSASEGIKFNGNKLFTFNLDNEASIVGENAAKVNGGATILPVTINPIKFEYGARISDEFLYASEEVQIDILSHFGDGMSKKFARALDIAALHGKNPKTGTASTIVGTNNFDSKITNTVTQAQTGNNPDTNVEDAIALVEGGDKDVTGIAMSKALRAQLGKLVDDNGRKIYPELSWGAAVGGMNGLPVGVNGTVSFGTPNTLAYVGDFETYFRWGVAKEIPLKIIEYGNPDNDENAGDLAGHNQIYVRAEVWYGWAIFDPASFSKIVAYA
jgi:HK97 family phage major capsid protein